MTDTVQPYDLDAARFAAQYEALAPEQVHAGLPDFLPGGAGRSALDVGAGSGRDAAWLLRLGFEVVVAAEPAAGMRAQGVRRHASGAIRWLDDRLPDLAATHRLGLSFDLILASAVWMHVPPTARPRAFRRLATLLKTGGLLVMSLREGPPEAGRPMWPAPLGEIEGLARAHGLAVLRAEAGADQMGRADVRWTQVILRLPDAGTEALPLPRGINNDDKRSCGPSRVWLTAHRDWRGTLPPGMTPSRCRWDAWPCAGCGCICR